MTLTNITPRTNGTYAVSGSDPDIEIVVSGSNDGDSVSGSWRAESPSETAVFTLDRPVSEVVFDFSFLNLDESFQIKVNGVLLDFTTVTTNITNASISGDGQTINGPSSGGSFGTVNISGVNWHAKLTHLGG